MADKIKEALDAILARGIGEAGDSLWKTSAPTSKKLTEPIEEMISIVTTPEGYVILKVGDQYKHGTAFQFQIPPDHAHKLAERIDKAATLGDLAVRKSTP